MTGLPIKRIVLYKHGVGYFERRGTFSGEVLTLSFPLSAMDDVLKSLVVIDRSGQVRNIDFATPEDRASLLSRGSIHLSDQRSLLDLLRDLRGRTVRLMLTGKQGEIVSGQVVGVDVEDERPLRRALVSLYDSKERTVRPIALEEIVRIELLDDKAHHDLTFFLRAAQNDERNRTATIHLTPGEHDLLIGYVAPAPAWRVSYRLLFEESADDTSRCFLQGWGLFDNQLEEDLIDVEVTLVAGQPVSFRYRLYEPQTPDRPFLQDQPRPQPKLATRMRAMVAEMAAPEHFTDDGGLLAVTSPSPAFTIDTLTESVRSVAIGEDQGALFAYRVTQPVSVGRGQSAMAPIVGAQLSAQRELVYNRRRLERHPLAALRLVNETGLTLEQGPTTVLINGEYAGESVLPFTRAGAQFVIFHAVELGVTVTEATHQTRYLSGIRLHESDLLLDEYLLTFQQYTIISSLATPCTVIIEYQRTEQTELIDTPSPLREDGQLACWAVRVPANGQMTFTVRERRLLSRRQTISSLTGEQLQNFLRDKVLDDRTFQRLKGVINLFHQIEAARQTMKQHEAEQKRIVERQQQLRQKIEPLRSDGEEGMLRQRYIASLAQLEDQLERLDTAIAEQQALIQKLTSQVERRLQRLHE